MIKECHFLQSYDQRLMFTRLKIAIRDRFDTPNRDGATQPMTNGERDL